jgi:hypothetical protein
MTRRQECPQNPLVISTSFEQFKESAEQVASRQRELQPIADSIENGMTKKQVIEAVGEPDCRDRVDINGVREVWKYELGPGVRLKVDFGGNETVVGREFEQPAYVW